MIIFDDKKLISNSDFEVTNNLSLFDSTCDIIILNRLNKKLVKTSKPRRFQEIYLIGLAVLKNNKVIVTGGAGFVGSHLVEKLIKNNCEVTVIDNYSSGSSDNHIQGAKYVSGSCIEINSLLKNESEADYLFHLGDIQE